MIEQQLTWHDPITMADNISQKDSHWVLLHSGLQDTLYGRFSILALIADTIIKEDDFSGFAELLSHDQQAFTNCYFGYLGYELKHALENYQTTKASFIHAPNLYMVKFKLILVFDHKDKTLIAYAKTKQDLKKIPQLNNKEITCNLPPISVVSLTSNMTSKQYLNKVTNIKQAIQQGDIYQANLTRKYMARLNRASKTKDSFALFKKLCNISPAPYSCFLKLGNYHVISSSPECFLTVDKHGRAVTIPIKGSAARHSNPKQDAISKQQLQDSVKDRSENLMIVDLSRNDLARCSKIGSVKVEELFKISTYSTIHHMSSTISAIKHPKFTTLDLVKACFPPGSMTGCPKIKAIEICAHLEQQNRGIYSGAIGYFGGDGSCNLSVVIRTIIINGAKLEFQVGGAIIDDSDPKAELLETKTKASAICKALGIDIKFLE